ncbi:MAG: two-component regulator propeller domain-containing protein [Bacteroidia bacterium]
MRKFLKAFFYLCFFANSSFSQSLFFKQVSITRDNPNLRYNTLFQDHNGLMWMATSEGLYQFDGLDFSRYLLKDKNLANDVTAISQDKDHVIWAGYKNGKIAYLKNDSLQLFNPEEGLPAKPITSILHDKKGMLWITTAGEGVYYFNMNRLYNINTDDGLNDNHAYVCMEDNSGHIWIGTDQGIAICSAEKKLIRKLTYKNNLPDEIIRDLKKDSEGNIWIATQDKGICRYDTEKNKIEIPTAFANWKYGQVNSFIISDKEFWIATEENGLINYNPLLFSDFRNFKESNSIKFSKADYVIKDTEGNIWISSTLGCIRTQGNTFSFLNSINNYKLSFIHTILVDKNSNLLFTPDQQLMKVFFMNGEVKTKYYDITPNDKLIDIVSLYEDKFGYIWIGTMGDGLYRLNTINNQKQKITGYPDLEHASILSVTGDEKEIWLATLGGVIKCMLPADYNKDVIQCSFIGLENQKELGDYFIYKIFIDTEHKVWIATDGKGLVCFDGQKYISYNKSAGLKSDIIYSIIEDAFGNIWFSTADEGIYKYNGKTFTNYNLSDGLRQKTITAIACDGNGNIVLVSRKGIDVLNISTGNIEYFDLEINPEGINPDINSIAVDQKGNVWAGTEDGIIKFNSHYKPPSVATKPVIKKAISLADNAIISSGRKLKYDQNNILVEFAGIRYANAEQVNYAYKMDGYNKDWIYTKDKSIIFSGLPPGKYSFHLKATIGNEFKHASETEVDFTVSKAFWNETWFTLIVIFILAGIAFFILRWRERELHRFASLEREKIKFQFETLKSQVNPHFLFNTFNTLIYIIENDKNIAVEYVENLSVFFRNLINYRDKDLITLQEEINLSSSYFFLQQKRFGKSLVMNLDIPEETKKYFLPPLVVQILIENAIKHNAVSKENPLLISLSANADKLTIKNNLNPKRNPEASTGSGLQNIINRYKILTSENVEVIKTEKDFIVSIPLIKPV